jgi:hypothetical protein
MHYGNINMKYDMNMVFVWFEKGFSNFDAKKLNETMDSVVGNLDEFINPVDKFIHFSSQKRSGQAGRVYGKATRGVASVHDNSKLKGGLRVASKFEKNRHRRISSSDVDLDAEEGPLDSQFSDGGGGDDGDVTNHGNESEENNDEEVDDSDDSDNDEVYNEKATFADDDSDGNDEDDADVAKADHETSSSRANLNLGELLSVKSIDETRSHTQPVSKSTFLNRSTLDTSSVGSNAARTSFRIKT